MLWPTIIGGERSSCNAAHITATEKAAMAAGLPIPVTTPAHGTAFDIAGRGTANPRAMRKAFEVVCRMSSR